MVPESYPKMYDNKAKTGSRRNGQTPKPIKNFTLKIGRTVLKPVSKLC